MVFVRVPTDVVDGAPLAWLRVTLLHQDPHVAEARRSVLDGVRASFELGTFPRRISPAARVKTSSGFGPRIWTWCSPSSFCILHYFDARTPWVFHECEFEEPRQFSRWRDDLDNGSFEFFHLRVKVRERETNVIDGASGAWFCVRFLKEQEPRATEHQSVRRVRDPPPAEILFVPIGGRCRIGRV
jgi:hypothetical protein